tara:strand:- start:454 stop:1209 length:756 start_codon:yes stop_codon:yes gene_type:complete
MSKIFENKVAIVTGGASGIGQTTAIEFAKKGAKVVVADISDGTTTIEAIRELGGDAIYVKTNVTKAEDVKRMVDTAVETYGHLDFAFNNAGIEKAGNLPHEYEESDFDKIYEVNLKGVWLCIKYEAEQMLKQGKGIIVNTSSNLGLVAAIHDPAYVATKHGVIGLTKQAGWAYGKMGIRVNCVCPGVIRTPLLEKSLEEDPAIKQLVNATLVMGRLGETIDVANAVLWLCSDKSDFINATALPIDGGWLAV